MRAVELFAGVGGFRLGLERAGHEVVYSNEWDKHACDTYDKNFADKGEPIDRRDITTIPTGDVPDHDIICGGFPCQSFSIAGKRKGFDETRGTLFFDIMRIARHHRTPYLFLENVKGLLNHDGGRTFETILETLDESGYDCQWQVLNSKNFGVPQNRERIIIIANLRGFPRPQVFPLTGTSSETTLSQINEQGRSVAERIYDTDGLAMTLSANGGGGGGKTGLYVIPVLSPDRAEKRQNGRRFKTDGEPSFTVTAIDRHGIYDGVKIRRLTPIECERLQGFPDNWTKEGVLFNCNGTKCAAGKYDGCLGHFYEQSDTQRYKQMGNAVTTNVIEAVARRLTPTWTKPQRQDCEPGPGRPCLPNCPKGGKK